MGIMEDSMKQKREQWRLPKEFKPDLAMDGFQQRHDGEPRIVDLVKHGNDRTLSAHEYIKCCDCGLTHLHTYNVMKTPNGKWFFKVRAYRVPGTGGG